MLTLAGIKTAFACLGAAMLVSVTAKGWAEYRKEVRWDFTKRFKDALYRGGLSHVYKRNLLAAQKLERARILSTRPEGYGVSVKVRLPVGLTLNHVYKALPVLKGALQADLDVEMEGQDVLFKVYNHPLPREIGLSALNGKEKTDLVLARSRRGVEVVDTVEPVAPHMLIGGATNMGKSNFLNLILYQLLQMPSELYLIDTKMVEFSAYEGASQVKDVAKDIDDGLRVAEHVEEILISRQDALARAGFKKIQTYNKYAANPLPNVYLVVDEFADFSGIQYFWKRVQAIARRGRAFGVYLILCTQRASVDALDQQVKSNLGVRVVFKCETTGNSRILMEKDDAYYLPTKPGRCLINTGNGFREAQVPLIRESELKALIKRKGVVRDDGDARRIGDPGGRSWKQGGGGDSEKYGSTYVRLPSELGDLD